ncbi:stress response translation initiation inhibitor YciH [Agaribacter marinus]|uniref:Translation initiation factor n=1 Tax=Agaribacter marinus TaxID=1431249 RepID=A0AA37T5R6_9ALTE|nr:stress response translation initiation inhibitor YciH [Agaribacter marinus]GLR72055.1 translation initiation factor [Agaribacter marinus]
MTNSRLVYSTESGRIQPSKAQEESPKGDGIVRLQRVTKGKKGKGITLVTGLGLPKDELKKMCTDLKKQCGCGGAVKNFDIEIQGDVRDKLKHLLESKGFKVKLAGG